MHLEGSHAFSASPDKIWELLNDPDVLVRTTPGLTSLEPDGEDVYKAEFQIKLGPVNGGFSGSLAVKDREPPRSYRLEIDVSGRIGSAKAEGTFDIRDENGGAVVTFTGDARRSWLLERAAWLARQGAAQSCEPSTRRP